MEEAFSKLEKAGKNTVEHLTKWMKSASLVTKDNESKVSSMLSEVSDKGKVSLVNFKNIVTQVATENKVNPQEIMSKLGSTAESFKDKISNAFKSFTKKG